MRLLRDDALVLGGGAIGASSSFDHSDITALLHPSGPIATKRDVARLAGTYIHCSPLLSGQLILQGPFPWTFFDTGGGDSVRPAPAPLDSDEVLTAPSSG